MDTLIYAGGELKALDDKGTVGGYLVKFGDAEHTDVSEKRDFFTPDTDFGLDLSTKSRMFYNHGLDPEIGKTPIGIAELKADKVGVWMQGQIKLRDAYVKQFGDYVDGIKAMVRAGKQGLSSGTAAHLVVRERQSNGSNRVLSWPLGLDASITPTPAEPRTRAEIKSLAEFKAHLPAHAGPSAMAAALERLHYTTTATLADHMTNPSLDRETKLARIDGTLGEHMAMAKRLAIATLPDEANPVDEAEVKSLIHEAAVRLHTGQRLASHLSTVLIAVKGLTDRFRGYAALRRADGRSIPPDHEAGIKALQDEFATILASAPDREASVDVSQFHARFLALSDRLR